MNDIEEKKIQIKEIITKIYNNIASILPESYEKEYTKDLLEDLNNELYTVVVVGEFKRGKSTFVNALLGEEILPADVTPTTATINAIMWNEERSIQVHKSNGNLETLELKKDNLNRYVADRDFDPKSVNYIKIGISSEILKNRLVLIDTPGVDDLNKQRVEVTYKFIPRADVVIFLLDSTNAVRRTEKEFLENNILKEGIDKIIFVANFIDQIDEDEDVEEIIEDIENRIRNILGSRHIEIMPVSAIQALNGILNKNQSQIESSGIIQISNLIKSLINSGSQATEKIKNYKNRALRLINSVEKEIQTLIQLENTSLNELNEELNKINQIIKDEERRKISINNYVSNQQQEMIAIVTKSVYYFGEELRRDIEDQFDSYKGNDFKDYIEKYIPKAVDRQIKTWMKQYLVYINKMFQMLEDKLTIGMARHFNASIKGLSLKRNIDDLRNTNIGTVSIEAEDISKTGVVAGAIGGGTAILLTVLGGGILMPLISMAGVPILGRKMIDKKLIEVKEKVKPELNNSMEAIINNLSNVMNDYVLNSTNKIMNACEERYDEIIVSVKKKIQKEIEDKETLKNRSEVRYNELSKFLKEIGEFKKLIGDDKNVGNI